MYTFFNSLPEQMSAIYEAARIGNWLEVEKMLDDGKCDGIEYVSPEKKTVLGRYSAEKPHQFNNILTMIALVKGLLPNDEFVDYMNASNVLLGWFKSQDNLTLTSKQENFMRSYIELVPVEHLNYATTYGTILLNLCRTSNTKAAMLLLEIEDINIDSISENHGDTALTWACFRQLVPVAHKLIDLGADVDFVSNLHSNTPLICLIMNEKCDLGLTLRLIVNSIKHNHANKYGYTALYYSLKYGLNQLSFAIIDAGRIDLSATLMITQPDEMIMETTYLCAACRYGRIDVARRILASGKSRFWFVSLTSETKRPYAMYLAESYCLSFVPELTAAFVESGRYY